MFVCIIFIISILLYDTISSCHAECSYQCDNPVCRAVVIPYCKKPNCYICGNNTHEDTPECVPWNNCYHQCLNYTNQCELDMCPMCSIHCKEPRCPPGVSCFIECNEPECGWIASKPTNCPLPRCILQCEQVACEYSGSHHEKNIGFVLMIAITILIYYIL